MRLRLPANRYVVAATAVGMIVSGFFVNANASLLALAAGLTVMFVNTAARRSTFQNNSQHGWVRRAKRFVQSTYVLAATGVAMVWVGALDTWTYVLLTLASGCVLAFILAVTPIRVRRSVVTPSSSAAIQVVPED